MSLIFNGSTDYVTVAHHSSLNITDAITIEVFVKLDVLDVSHSITSKGTSAANAVMDLWIYGTNNNLYFDAPEADIRINVDPSFVVNEWNHLVVTYDKDGGSDNLNVYLNGDNIAKGTDTDAMGTNTDDLRIGRIGDSYFNGIIDDVRIWNRALTLEEITDCYIGTAPRNGLVAEWLMNEGFGSTAYDTSVNSNDGTITGATWGNDFTSNPWIIKAAASGDVSTSLPTYNGNTGTHVAYGIVSFYWTGATATHVCEVKDVSAERIWKSVCTTTNIEPKFKPCEPIVIKGLNISTLESGTLYIYHT